VAQNSFQNEVGARRLVCVWTREALTLVTDGRRVGRSAG
jgi:hypothetical protein